jgi:sulfonate transport system substrate-binding protein
MIGSKKILGGLAVLAALAGAGSRADTLTTLHVDFAYYNPVSLVLKDKHFVEDAVGPDIKVEWVQSAGSNKALEYPCWRAPTAIR